MSVGGIRGGGRGGGVKGPKGPGGTSKAGGGTFGKVDRSEKLVGPSGLSGSAEVGPSDPVSMQVLAIARALKSGEIGSKSDAAQKLVASILRERLRLGSKALSKKISDHLQEDPRLAQTLDRLWARG